MFKYINCAIDYFVFNWSINSTAFHGKSQRRSVFVHFCCRKNYSTYRIGHRQLFKISKVKQKHPKAIHKSEMYKLLTIELLYASSSSNYWHGNQFSFEYTIAFSRIFVPRVCINTQNRTANNKSNKATKRLFCMHSPKIWKWATIVYKLLKINYFIR